jgi:uncharacterized DUF497 family protein
MIRFEFDPIKSKANSEKHGIDFSEAKKLWRDSDIIDIPARTDYEPRFLVIGKINQKCLSAVITYRSISTRIISVRRPSKEEIELYESQRI